jgi:hypothetical protein
LTALISPQVIIRNDLNKNEHVIFEASKSSSGVVTVLPALLASGNSPQNTLVCLLLLSLLPPLALSLQLALGKLANGSDGG